MTTLEIVALTLLAVIAVGWLGWKLLVLGAGRALAESHIAPRNRHR